MIEIGSYIQWQDVLRADEKLLLFVETDNCSVCAGLYPLVNELSADYPFTFYKANASQVPELAGQLSLFAAPVVLLFYKGRETARFARFVIMDELKYRLDEMMEWSGTDE